MRTDAFLNDVLMEFLEDSFSDLTLMNEMVIRFGRRAKRRFGSISMTRDKRRSVITVNGLFKQEIIPDEIIKATIAHELCHYAHGFSSPLKRKYSHPHKGGVILSEMKMRGLEDIYRFEKTWTKKNWRGIVEAEFGKQVRRNVRRVRVSRKSFLGKIIFDLIKP